VVGTAVLASVVKAVLGLRPDLEDEDLGLDYTDHGEAGYHTDEPGAHVETVGAGVVQAASTPSTSPATS
jgi:hypothetical protein